MLAEAAMGADAMNDDGVTLINADVLTGLGKLADESVQCVVTSPPYWGLRDYKINGQLGLEDRFEVYLERMVHIFAEVRRVLRKDGTCWLNMGDCYVGGGRGGRAEDTCKQATNVGSLDTGPSSRCVGLKAKDLVGMPWRVAFALQADGWWLRSDIIWAKPNPMPESVTDRPTKAHEYIFLMTKSARYYYDAVAIREPVAPSSLKRIAQSTFDDHEGGPKDGLNPNRSCRKALENFAAKRVPAGWATSKNYKGQDPRYQKRDKQRGHSRRHNGFNDRWDAMEKDQQQANGANKRTIWTIATFPFPEAHFATFPEALVEPCILAGTSDRGACVKCGAPWKRHVERAQIDANDQEFGGKYQGQDDNSVSKRMAKKRQRLREITGNHDDYFPPVVTLGWIPSCECGAGVRPCMVFDPFAGSGTTLAVAKRFNRDAVGIEINPEYCEMAGRRIADVQRPLF